MAAEHPLQARPRSLPHVLRHAVVDERIEPLRDEALAVGGSAEKPAAVRGVGRPAVPDLVAEDVESPGSARIDTGPLPSKCGRSWVSGRRPAQWLCGTTCVGPHATESMLVNGVKSCITLHGSGTPGSWRGISGGSGNCTRSSRCQPPEPSTTASGSGSVNSAFWPMTWQLVAQHRLRQAGERLTHDQVAEGAVVLEHSHQRAVAPGAAGRVLLHLGIVDHALHRVAERGHLLPLQGSQCPGSNTRRGSGPPRFVWSRPP